MISHEAFNTSLPQPAYPYQLPNSEIVHEVDTDIMIQVHDLQTSLRFLDNLRWRKGCGGNNRLFIKAGDDISKIASQYKLRLEMIESQMELA